LISSNAIDEFVLDIPVKSSCGVEGIVIKTSPMKVKIEVQNRKNNKLFLSFTAASSSAAMNSMQAKT